MRVNIQEFLKNTGLTELLYPGKRFIKKCAVPGEFKSHAIEYDWRSPEQLRVEVKAGLTGEVPAVKDLKKYPASLQTKTFFEINVSNDDSEEDSEEGEASGKGGSGGKGLARKKEEGSLRDLSFMKAVEGAIPSAGEVARVVVMGMEIAKEAHNAVLNAFFDQAQKAKISATELLKNAGNMVTKYAPPAFMEAKGDVQAAYVYDRDRNASMFGMNFN